MASARTAVFGWSISTDSPVDMPDGPEILVHTSEAVDLHARPFRSLPPIAAAS